MDLEKTYDPQRFESHWARWWVETGIFHADAKAPGPRFSLAVPPPNVTGSMHIGHMLEHSVIDAAIRWRRMSGYNTLFLPGVDHAGIATQMLVERSLAEEGLTRKGLGREEFVKRVWAWKEKYGSRITEQMKRIGDSCDWSRERFTLSPELSRAVLEAFVRLYERDLIYRGTYMVNWCPRCQTALSDLEVKHEDTQGTLWHIRYPLKDGSRNLVVVTTRPETMLGDTAVAVNPKDPRYSDLAGTTAILPLMNREIPIIFDELADPQFGTGVVKVTPAHDPMATMFAMHAGMRNKEIRTLNWSKIDISKRLLTVGESKTEAGAGRTIPMNEDLYTAVVEYTKWYTSKFGIAHAHWYVFPFGAPVPSDPTRPQTSLKTAWRNARTRANVQGRFHDNRHTFVTDLAESGAADEVIRDLAGHVSKDMLKHYSHIRTLAKRQAVQALVAKAPCGPANIPESTSGDQSIVTPNSGTVPQDLPQVRPVN